MSASDSFVALAVAVPLGAAALLAGANRVLGRSIRDLVALGAAAATAGLAAVALAESAHRPIVYWFGGWRPVKGTVIGVDYVVDPLGAGLALLAALLALGALVYSQRYFAGTGARYPALVLVFLAASIDFAWTGDLFNMFVAFELVAVVGFILTGYYASEEAPLQGALNFAVTNTVGGLVVLMAVTILYGYTGTLNLAQMGQVLAGHRPDGVVAVALAMLCAGFLVKAAVVPWHFWLPDAYGAAPAPTCVIFAGVLSELGLFGLARVWETVFSAVVSGPAEQHLRLVLAGLGILSALVGTAMSLVESYGRRILAFVVVAHMGLYLLGFALLRTVSLGGVALLAAGDGFTKAALFLAVGVIRRRRRETGGRPLRGGGGRVSIAVGVVVVGSLALADLPPFATSVGKDLLVAGAGSAAWLVETVFVITTVGTSGAVLASTARVWRGQTPEESSPAEDRAEEGGTPVAVLLLLPAVVLLAAGLALGLLPGIAGRAVRAAQIFSDRRAYVAAVLHARALAARPAPAAPGGSIATLLGDGAEAAGAIAFALLLLSARRLQEALGAATTVLRRLHRGHVGDQVTWSLAGLAALAGLFAVAFR